MIYQNAKKQIKKNGKGHTQLVLPTHFQKAQLCGANIQGSYQRRLDYNFCLVEYGNLLGNGEKTPIYKVTTNCGDNIVRYDPIGTPEDIKLCDVSYLRQHSLALDEERLREIKCKEIKNILSDSSMLGMVKHSAWEYEKETRLCIVMPPNSEQRYPDKIAIDFDGIHGATVMGSPCLDPSRIQETIDGLKREFISVNKQKQIINSIHFDVADTKHCVSALKDKLYLPTFCSFCTKQSKCNLYKTINR